METVPFGTLETLVPDLESDRKLELEPPDARGASFEGVTASLLPVPPPRPERGTRSGTLSRLALATAEDGCLDLVGMLGRWIMESLLLRPSAVFLPASVCGR